MDYSDTDMMKYVTKALADKAFREKLRNGGPDVANALAGPQLTERQIEMLSKLTDEDWERLAQLKNELAPECFCNFA